MAIWKRDPDLASLRATGKDTILTNLGIEFTEVGDDYLTGTMPVDARTHQPYGLLHGGASVVLAESLGSTAGYLCLEDPDRMVVGLDINANHIRAKTEGLVTGTARALHVGRNTQVWDIRIVDERQRLVCISRLTLAVIDRPAG